MPQLEPCPACHAHVLADERACPHCGQTIARTSASRVPVLLMGLALAGCPGPQPEPDYGIPDTGFDDSGTGTDTGTDTAGEPDYGVPETTEFQLAPTTDE